MLLAYSCPVGKIEHSCYMQPDRGGGKVGLLTFHHLPPNRDEAPLYGSPYETRVAPREERHTSKVGCKKVGNQLSKALGLRLDVLALCCRWLREQGKLLVRRDVPTLDH